MKLSTKQKNENIKNNIEYGIRSRKETKKSFSQLTGITRTTIYNILDGKVNRIQNQTVERIANFFGTSCHVIEEESLEEVEFRNQLISRDGNQNPIAIPILSEIEVIKHLHTYIGELILFQPTTYCFSDENNMISVNVGKMLSRWFDIGNLLIVKRSCKDETHEQLILTKEKNLSVKSHNYVLDEQEQLIGCIYEERCHAAQQQV